MSALDLKLHNALLNYMFEFFSYNILEKTPVHATVCSLIYFTKEDLQASLRIQYIYYSRCQNSRI